MSGTYLLIGDSQAVGLEDELRAAMEARDWVQAGVHARVGIGTAATALAVSGLPRADLAIVVLGGNDTAGPALERAIGELVRRIPATKIAWIGPAHARPAEIEERKRAVAQLQARVVPSAQARWIDGGPLTADLEHAPDGLHFVRSAHRVLADRVAAMLFITTDGFWAGAAIALAVVGGTVLGFGVASLWR